MRRAVFRADGSSQLGMGHIMRCVAFATGLRDIGMGSVFVTRALEPSVPAVIRSSGFDVEGVPSTITTEEDIRLTREIAARVGASLIVTDLWHWPALENPAAMNDYHKRLGAGFFVVGLATGEVTDMPADIVVSPYVSNAKERDGVPGGPLLLSGPKYFIFRPEFIAAAQESRRINQEAKRVLVIIGGSDELHLTTKIVEALCSLSDRGLSVRVVLGPAYPQQVRHDVTKLLARFAGEYQFLEHGANLAQAMLWADLAIVGPGFVKYESAVIGTPSIVLSRTDNERALNQVFVRAGTALHLSDACGISIHALADKIQRVLNDFDLRTSMSQHGKVLLDGRGLARIIAHVPARVLR